MSVVYHLAALAVVRYQMELCRSYATLNFFFVFKRVSSAGVRDPEKNRVRLGCDIDQVTP
jgi:hypothetical protein